MFSATVVADSVSSAGKRITTLSLAYPRFIHSEFMTHRAFSRNAASSRAIPIKKMLDEIRNNPAMPVWWGKNQKGMAAEEELDEENKKVAIATWLQLRDLAVLYCERLEAIGLHKQLTNRLIEPWQHMATVVTSTEWENFKRLRIHKKAQPEFKELAGLMREAVERHTPVLLRAGEWHLPYVPTKETWTNTIHTCIKYSVARCARVSYKTHEGEIDPAKDVIRFWELLSSGHMSPFEHQASPHADPNHRSGNFLGWNQYRKFIPNEAIFDEGEGAVDARREFAEREFD